jgi:hypothetical protein
MRLRFLGLNAALVSLVALILGGCGSSDSPDGSTGASSSTSDASSSASGGTGSGTTGSSSSASSGSGGQGGGGTGGGSATTTTTTTGSSSGTGTGGGLGFVPAPHPPAPQVVTLGGPVLTTPRVIAFTYNSDVNQGDVDTFTTQLAASTYWPAIASEYGVGALTVGTPVHLTGAAPTSTTDAAVVKKLQTNLSGANPVWGAPDPMAIYAFVFPEGSNVDSGCCTDFGGYHDETTVGNTKVAYAILCTCPGFDGPGFTTLESLTTALSHEIIEAATDPFPQTDPAFTMTDDANISWSLITQGEVGDMCEFDADQYLKPADMNYIVQRSWSNAAAAAGKDPCVLESTPPDVYFNSVPVVSDTLNATWYFGPVVTKGVKIPLGQTRTIDVQLFSDAPMPGPWTVAVYDYNEIYGGTPNLQMSFNTTTGSNGDVLKLTIKALKKDANFGVSPFYIESTLGNASNLWMGVVGQ